MKATRALLAVSCIAATLALALNGTAAMPRTSESDCQKAITDLLNRQAEAWNRGDIEAFMTGYLQSAETSYTSGGKDVWGYQPLLARYREKYGTRSDTMGKLTFADLHISALGRSHALCIGHWYLARENQEPLKGTFSLVLKQVAHQWKILHDHTSTAPAPTRTRE